MLLIGVGSGSGLSGCGDDGPRLVVQSAAAPVTEQAGSSPASSPVVSTADAVVVPAATEPPVVTVTPTGVVVQITALDNSFRPQSIEINIGDEVVWENRGRNEHNVLRVEGDGWGVEAPSFQPGDRYGFVFSEPGEYHYYCSIHGNEQAGMTGTISVSA